MQINSRGVLFILAVLGVALGTSALADDSLNGNSSQRKPDSVRAEERMDTREEKKLENICEQVSKLSDNFNRKVSEQEAEIKTRQENRLTRWSERMGGFDVKMEERRSDWDENREEQVAGLRERTENEEQEAAVNSFEAAVKAAVATRRAAMDKALEAFRAGVKNVIGTRKSQIDQLVTASASARNEAIKKAAEACTNGANSETVRATLRTSLQGAQTKIKADRQSMERINTEIKALTETRRQAVEKAQTDFQAAMEKARVELKKAFVEELEDSQEE